MSSIIIKVCLNYCNYWNIESRYDKIGISKTFFKESRTEVFFMVIANMLKQAIEKKHKWEVETIGTNDMYDALKESHNRLKSQFDKLKEMYSEKSK